MLPGYHTQNFVSELFRLTDISSSQAVKISSQTPADFSWIDKYKSTGALPSSNLLN